MAKIMLVEDDNNLREIYEARLQAEGYTLISAKDGEEALVLAKNEKPDLVISDVMMPKISGFEMLDILRNTEGLKEVKVIMLTALGQSDDQQRADRLGADRYLVKSQVTLEDIVKVAHDLLEDTPASAEPTPPAADPLAPPATAEPAAPATASVAPPATEPAVEPVAPTSDVPAAEPVAVVPSPAVEPVASPTPAATAAVDDVSTDSAAQSTAQEEASVEAKIEDFVEGASSEAPAVAPAEPTLTAPAAEPAAVPALSAVPVPEPVAAPSADSLAASNAASDDKVMAQAVTDLAAGSQAPTAPPAPITIEPLQTTVASAPVASSTPAVEPAPERVANGSVPIAHKKIITPLDSEPKQDINTLLALEEAKEAAAASAATTPSVVTSDESAAPAPSVPAPAANPTVSAPAAPAAEVGPTPPAAANSPLDPNSIAL